MPIISIFPTGSGGSGGGGIPLAAVTGITTKTCHEKVYVKWSNPIDTSAGEAVLAKWSGTLLVRKAGSMPTNRRDGQVVVDNKERDKYKSQYFCDSGLSDGVEYFYKFFPYSTTNTYTDDPADEFTATPNPVPTGDISGLTVVAQLNERVQLKWNDPNAAVIEDGITLATWASTKVVYKEGSYPTSPDDGELVETVTTRNKYASSPLTVTGLTNGTTYYFALFPISTEGTVNTNTVGRITATPNKTKLTKVPTQKNVPTYTGDVLTAEFNDYNPTQLTLTGDKTGTDVKTYNAIFTPTADYCWAEGDSEPKTVQWTINRAALPKPIVSKSSITLNSDTLQDTFNVTRVGDGVITAESNKPTVATATVQGNVVTVKSVNNTTGDAVITVKVNQGKNYLAYTETDVTVNVKAEFIPPKAVLNTMSWADIRKVSDAGLGDDYWDVGDAKEITINGTIGTTAINQKIWAFILGFDHNKAKESPNNHAIHFQIGRSAQTGGNNICFVDSTYGNYNANQGSFTMNPAADYNHSTNTGGWASSKMRTVVLGSDKAPSAAGANTFIKALPEDLQTVLKPITKYSDNKGGGTDVVGNVTETTDYLFLLSEFEVQGTRTYANSYEQNNQVQYDFCKTNTSKKVFYRHNATTSTALWWLRSVYSGGTPAFCIVDTDGSANRNISGFSYGVAPGFCV